MKAVLAILALALSAGCPCAMGLGPLLDISQYAHRSWTVRDGLPTGVTFAMAQTPDGYLWLGSEFGLFRFDGVSFVQWQPPAEQRLPDKPYSLLVTRNGTLWIGTFAGLASWDGKKLVEYPQLHGFFVTSLLEDRDGTVWAGTLHTPAGELCAIRTGRTECYGQDGMFGTFIWSLGQDGSGALWAGAESGLWRWKPGPPKRYSTGARVADMATSVDGRLIFGIDSAGLKQVLADKLNPLPIHTPRNATLFLSDHDIDSNKLLRDRDGGLWIGTHQHGLIHVHNGRTDVFTKSDGLSGNVSCSLFEDREGNIWFASSRGLDKFRSLPVITVSTNQGLASDLQDSIVAANDGSVWIGSHDGLTRWKNGRTTIFRKGTGVPSNHVQSLFQDPAGRIWGTFQGQGLAYFENNRFVSVPGVPSEEVFSITGDKAGNLWLSGNKGLAHLHNGHLVGNLPWSALGRQQQAKIAVYDSQHGGIWLSFWTDGGVLFFKDGRVRASYTSTDGLGRGHVPGLRLDQEGAIWAATEEGGLSRIKDGHIATLTTRNGLPCDTIHWSIEDDDRSLWMYTACGLVHIGRTEVEAWIANPTRRVDTTLLDTVDGVSLAAVSPAYYSPQVAKSSDGKLWFLGVQVVDPRHLPFNKIPPPVHIERIFADHKVFWTNLPGAAVANLRVPARTRDLTIDYTALSLVSPQKVHFKYRLEGQDTDWREVVNDREVQYSNLPPGTYRFRVIAANNSGVWNEQGDTLEFSIAPAYYQTNWFRALCAAMLLGLLWAMSQLRVRQLQHEFAMSLDARVDERTRIARDLHDTLLQSFHGLLFRFQAVRNLLPKRPEEAIQALDAALLRAEEALDEGRRSIQNLRPEGAPENELDRTLMATGQELASAHQNGSDPPQFKMIVEGERRPLSPLVKEEVIRVARELLRNAFQHARARNIEAEIRYEHDVFRLIIRDDGTGIDPKILKEGGRPGHWGLPGVHERATEIGAKLEFWSEAGAGAEVRLTVPSAIAYGRPRSVVRFKLFRDRRIHEHKS